MLFPNIWTQPHFQRIYWESLSYGFVLHMFSFPYVYFLTNLHTSPWDNFDVSLSFICIFAQYINIININQEVMWPIQF